MNRLRRNFGLRWQRETPQANDLGFSLSNIAIVAAIVLAYGIVGSLDYADEQAARAERAEQAYALQQTALLACLNNGSTGHYSVDSQGHRHYIVCETYTVSDENISRRPM